jgi:hypothetical protein
MKSTNAKIANFWCRLMHSEPMWPAHGQYECRTCGQRHRVCWDQPELAAPLELALRRGMLAQSASATATESSIQCSYQ